MDTSNSPPLGTGRFSRTVEIGWHVISAIVLVGTIIAASAVGYGYLAVMQTRLDRVISDQREDRDSLRMFATEVRVSLEKISDQIAGLRADVAKK
jgi:hypothetical protein